MDILKIYNLNLKEKPYKVNKKYINTKNKI